jgi:membrane-associated phospholipid phosphatase
MQNKLLQLFHSAFFTLFMLTPLFLIPQSLYANARDDGDALRLILPGIAGIGAVLAKDMDGVSQLGVTLVVATASTESLKYITHERRPNGECCVSFPSGHASVAFGSAAFVHHRYGFLYSVPFYLAASYVGYSRVFARSHYTQDVIAGAGVGFLSAYVSTTAFKGRPIALVLDRKYAGILYRKLFDF